MLFERLAQRLGATPSVVWRAPGRVNVIGEHVDYTGGLALPFACDLEMVLAVRPLRGEIVVESLDEPGVARIRLDGDDPGPVEGWGRYLGGVVRALMQAGHRLRGFHGVLGSAIPAGAGLSSSAALEAVLALAALGGARPEAETLRRAEHLAVGVPCGVMDQVAVLHGVAGHALALDCREVSWEPVRLPAGTGWLVVDTGTRRSLDDGRYNARRVELAQAMMHAGVSDLRTADPDDESVAASRRLRHVVTENRRAASAMAAVAAGDLQNAGRAHRCFARLAARQLRGVLATAGRRRRGGPNPPRLLRRAAGGGRVRRVRARPGGGGGRGGCGPVGP